MQPVSTSSVLSEILETAPRRRLYCEIVALKEAVDAFHEEDAMTAEIQIWVNKMYSALRAGWSHETVLSAYIPVLQDLLRDPLLLAPLDMGAFLASDGRTYGEMSAKIVDRSSGGSISYYRSHLPVRSALMWLDGYGKMLFSRQLERAYLRLFSAEFPSFEDRMQSLRAAQARREEALASRWENAQKKMQESLRSRLQSCYEEGCQQISQAAAQARQAAEGSFQNLEGKLQEQARERLRLEEKIKTFASQRFSLGSISDAEGQLEQLGYSLERLKYRPIECVVDASLVLMREIQEKKKQIQQHLERQESEIEERIVHLAEQQRRQCFLQQKMQNIQADVQALEKEVLELRHRVAKKKKKDWSQGILAIGCTVFASAIMTAAFQSLGLDASAHVATTGARFHFNFKV